jgi:hypothetical protein
MAATIQFSPARSNIPIPWPPEPSPSPVVNRWLDRFVDQAQVWSGAKAAPYLTFGICGIAAGLAAFLALGLARDQALLRLFPAAVGSVLSFVAAGLARKALRGREYHVLLTDALLAMATVAAIAASTGSSIATILDPYTIGLGVFLVFGRIGCLAGGCCYGGDSPIGVRYSYESSPAPYLGGVRLFPVQLVEAIWIFAVTLVSLVVLLVRGADGSATWTWLLTYGSGRFVLDLARGDRAKRRVGALTSAQWVIVGIFFSRLAFELVSAAEPTERALAPTAAALAIVAAWLTRKRWFDLPRATISADEIPAWCRRLRAMETAARARMGHEVEDADPGAEWALRLEIDPAEKGSELWCYRLTHRTGSIERSAGSDIAGLITARLPHHHVLLFTADAEGAVHLWISVVEPEHDPVVCEDDESALVLYRARAFSRAMQLAPGVPIGGREVVVDPALMPPESS